LDLIDDETFNYAIDSKGRGFMGKGEEKDKINEAIAKAKVQLGIGEKGGVLGKTLTNIKNALKNLPGKN